MATAAQHLGLPGNDADTVWLYTLGSLVEELH
jgi:hypothetical protein